MAPRVTHLVDEQAPEDALRQLSVVLGAVPADRARQRVLVAGRPGPALKVPVGTPVTQVGRRARLPLDRPSPWRRVLADGGTDVLHAWGASAAATARSVRPPDVPLVATLADPAEIDDVRRFWPLQSNQDGIGHGTVICQSQCVRRRVVSLGVPCEAAAVIQPGIDAAAMQRAGRQKVRASLGLPGDAVVLLTASPPSRAGGQFLAAWAAAILFQVRPTVRLIIPGRSREQERIGRLIEGIYCRQVYRLVGDGVEAGDLLAACDLAVMPATGDVPTWWAAAAMAAGVPVVGSDVAALAELVCDGRSGFLCQPGQPHVLAGRLREVLDLPDAGAACAARARRFAAESFAVGRCAEAHLDLYGRLARDLAGSRSAV